MTIAHQAIIGCSGAIISEALHWHRLVKRGRFPKYARLKSYWVLTFIIILAGGFVATVISPPGSTPTQLLLLGMVGPQIISAVAQSRIKIQQDQDLYLGDDRHSIGDFLAQ